MSFLVNEFQTDVLRTVRNMGGGPVPGRDILRRMEKQSGKEISVAKFYPSLSRLVSVGFLSREERPVEKQGGLAPKSTVFVTINESGRHHLDEADSPAAPFLAPSAALA